MSANSIFQILSFFLILFFIQTHANGIFSLQHKLQKRHMNGNDKIISDLQNDYEAIIKHINQPASVTLNEAGQLRPKKDILRNFINKLRGDIEELNDINKELYKSNENLRLENYELINIIINAGEDENNNTCNINKTEIEELRNITKALQYDIGNVIMNQLNGKSFEKLQNQIEELRNLTMKLNSTVDELRGKEKGKIFEGCGEALSIETNHDGVYEIHLPTSGLDPFKVYCMRDENNNGSAWTIVLRRQDGTVNFYRSWREYQQGFGNVSGEYFIGLQQLHALTQAARQELFVKLIDFENNTRFAKYDWFIIGDAANKYPLKSLGKYEGDAGDALVYHKGRKFSTMDADNDDYSNVNCAQKHKGANWYDYCQNSSLFGPYKHENEHMLSFNEYGVGVTWYPWHNNRYSLKYAHMAVRPAY